MNIPNHSPILQFSLLSIPKAANSNFKAKPCFQLETHGLVPSGFRELQGSRDAQLPGAGRVPSSLRDH